MSSKPVIDYTNKDFASLRQAMLDLASYRLPEWTDRSPGDPGALLVDLFAYMGDVILYYQDRIANESFLHSAAERRSVMHHLRLIGYELKPAVAASADLTLDFDPPGPGDPTVVTIPAGARFTAEFDDRSTESFEYLGLDLPIDLTGSQVEVLSTGQLRYVGLPVRHSRLVGLEGLGSSTGEPNQRFRLGSSPVIPETVRLEVDPGSGFVQWEQRETLLYHRDAADRVVISGPLDRAYTLQYDEDGVAWCVFGDGLYGRVPAPGLNNVRATYRVGGGTGGNVPAATISRSVAAIPLLASVINPDPAAGGAGPEEIDHGVRFGPLAFRSGHRAVTAADFVAMAHRAGGVAKVRARAAGLNKVELFVAPEGDTCRPVPDDLKKRLLAYFEDKRMAGTIVYIRDSVCVAVDVSLSVIAERHYDPGAVRREVEASVRDLFAFDNVHFAETLYLSKIYERVEALDGVHAVNVARFWRVGELVEGLAEVLAQFGVPTVDDLPPVVAQAFETEVAPNGRIDLGPFEIPSLGTLVVEIQEVEE